MLVYKFFKIRSVFKKCDIVHALDGWPYGFIAVMAGFGLRKKIVITAIGSGAVQPLYRFFKKPLMIWAYRMADRITAVSSNTKKEILKVVSGLDIDVINHGVDFDRYQTSNTKYKNDIEVQNLKPYILSICALKKRKGLLHSIKAFGLISKEFPDLKYVIVGKGSERFNLNKLIETLRLNGKVIFFDTIDEDTLIALYKNAELFILLPIDQGKDIEGFGLVFLEAAAFGLPVIASQDSSAEDAVRDGVNGSLVSPEDTEKVAKAINRILSNKKIKDLYSANSIKFAQSMSWAKAASAYSLVYKELSGVK